MQIYANKYSIWRLLEFVSPEKIPEKGGPLFERGQSKAPYSIKHKMPNKLNVFWFFFSNATQHIGTQSLV